MYTYLVLDSLKAFLIDLFTAGYNGVMKLYPTSQSSHYMMVSHNYFYNKFGVPKLFKLALSFILPTCIHGSPTICAELCGDILKTLSFVLMRPFVGDKFNL